MACGGSLSRTSSPLTEPLHCSDPAYSAPDPTALCGALLSGRVPLRVDGARGINAAAAQAQCQLVELRGAQVASFRAGGAELLCLPQVFELFLKHLVGGLHTVYTKLKRLNIAPHVCTVEQVRALRALGAIQPGVNRCKLITRADFDTLYRDCTCASSRPGRPPKRTLGVATMTDGSRLLPPGLLNPTLLSPTGVTAAAMAEALKMQKVRMMMGFHGNSDQQRHHNAAESENDDTGGSEASWDREQQLLPAPPGSVAPPPGSASLHLSTLQHRGSLLASRLSDLPFMVMPHPLLHVGLPPASVAMAMSQMTHLSGLANMAAVSECKLTNTPTGSPSPCPSHGDDELHPLDETSQSHSRASSLSSSSPLPAAHILELGGEKENTEEELKDKDETLRPLPLLKPANEKLPLTTESLSIYQANPTLTPLLLAEGLSSMETLLTNIQGLLKVAVQSAHSQNKQNQTEKKELKLELERERDARHSLQRQLSSELHTTAWIQRRLKKEKKAKRRLQEALESESKRREQVERARTHLDTLTDTVIPDSEDPGDDMNVFRGVNVPALF